MFANINKNCKSVQYILAVARVSKNAREVREIKLKTIITS